MNSYKFPEANVALAEDQPEYETLHVFVDTKQTEDGKFIPWSATACFELTDEEVAEIVATRKVWHTQMLYGHNFQPILMTTKSPLTN